MSSALLPPAEPTRLNVLGQYEILDSQPEKALDDLTAMAAEICETPIALVTIIDEHRVWFKSKFGVGVSEISSEGSFCACALSQREIMIVPDTTIIPWLPARRRFAFMPAFR
jgi:hypothetical protein